MNTGTPRCWGVLPAAGVGNRMGGERPKQYLQLAGATLFEHSLSALLDSPRITGVMVALHADDQWANQLDVTADPRVHLVTGGAQRSDSVLAALLALESLAEDGDWVLVQQSGNLIKREITLGRRGANRSQVVSGLERDEKVALFPPGMKSPGEVGP